jgi:hypothetical protein
VPLYQSGFIVPKDGKALASLYDKDGREILIASQNKDKLKCFVVNESAWQEKNLTSRFIKLAPDAIFAEITFQNGKKRKVEFYYGDTYLSQSSRQLRIEANMSQVVIYNSKGETKKIEKVSQ